MTAARRKPRKSAGPITLADPLDLLIQPGAPQLGPRIGVSGQQYEAGFPGEEYHPDLDDPVKAADAMDKLRIGNATIAGILQRLEAPIRQATWDVAPGEGLPEMPSLAKLKSELGLKTEDPAGDDRSFVAVNLLKSNLFGQPAGEYASKHSWRQQTLHEFLTAQAFGFAAFEKTYRIASGPFGTFYVLDGLWWIHPRSIREIRVTRDGRLVGIQQEIVHGWNDSTQDGRGSWSQEYVQKFIPAERLFMHARNREGVNPTGHALTRHMYGDAKRQEAALRWQIIDAQNRAVGIPIVILPKGATPKQHQDATRVARRLTTGNKEQAWVVAEDGTQIGFMKMEADVPDIHLLVQAQEARMQRVAGTEFTQLGQSGTSGSRAVAEELAPFFELHVKAIADAIVEDVQRAVIDPLHESNFGRTVPAPRLTVGNVARPNLKDIYAAVTAHVVKADGDVEQAVRRALDLPPLDAEVVDERNERSRQPPPEIVPGPDGRPVVMPSPSPATKDRDDERTKLSELTFWRPLTPHESEFVRLADIKAELDDFTGRFLRRIRPLREQAIVEAAEKARPSGMKLTVKRPGSKAIKVAMLGLADEARLYGEQQALAEIRRQVAKRGKRIALATTTVRNPFVGGATPATDAEATLLASVTRRVDSLLDVTVGVDVERLINDIVAGLQMSYTRALETGMSQDRALQSAVDSLIEGGARVLEDAARAQGTRALNGGRAEALAESLDELTAADLAVEYVVRTEALDDRTCPACEDLDGREIRVDSDDYWTFMPPSFCEGGPRCRGLYLIEVQDR